MGYRHAGFDVTGIDHRPQPRYPGRFIQADALEYLARHGHEFDAIHASPPCQAFTHLRAFGKHAGLNAPDLVEPTRAALIATGRPWVIENVAGSPLNTTIVLCGSTFGLLVRRHRLFESNVMLWGVPCKHHEQPRVVGVYGEHPQRSLVSRYGANVMRAATLAEGQEAMGIDWMLWPELTQAIPPVYTEWVGAQLMAHLALAVAS